MSSLTELSAVAILALVGMTSIAMTGEESGPVWALLTCATALPTDCSDRSGWPWPEDSCAPTGATPGTGTRTASQAPVSRSESLRCGAG